MRLMKAAAFITPMACLCREQHWCPLCQSEGKWCQLLRLVESRKAVAELAVTLWECRSLLARL